MLYWLANLLPAWLFYLVPLAGFAALVVLHLVPLPGLHVKPLRWAATGVLVVGAALSGYVASHNDWQQRAQQLQQLAQQTQQQSQQANAEIQTRVVTKTKIIREQGEAVVKYIDREVVKYDQQCSIPNEVVDAHNRVAGGKP